MNRCSKAGKYAVKRTICRPLGLQGPALPISVQGGGIERESSLAIHAKIVNYGEIETSLKKVETWGFYTQVTPVTGPDS